MNNVFISFVYIGEVRLITFGCVRFRMGASVLRANTEIIWSRLSSTHKLGALGSIGSIVCFHLSVYLISIYEILTLLERGFI